MHFILMNDIESVDIDGNDRHFKEGELLNQMEFTMLCYECGVVKANCFLTLEDALEWNASQDV